MYVYVALSSPLGKVCTEVEHVKRISRKEHWPEADLVKGMQAPGLCTGIVLPVFWTALVLIEGQQDNVQGTWISAKLVPIQSILLGLRPMLRCRPRSVRP